MKFNGIYIPTIDGKDVYINSTYNNENEREFSLKTRTGTPNLKKFINSLDYSLDLPELSRIYRRVNNGNKLWFENDGKRYTQSVINLTFKYSVKQWNKISRNKYIKYGYNPRTLEFNDCIAYSGSEIVGIETDSKVSVPCIDEISNGFVYDEELKEYKAPAAFSVIASATDVRRYLYNNGFVCDGVKYIRYKRSAGSARVGKCLFIEESLYEEMFKYSTKGLYIQQGQEIDLAAFESYISLPMSSCIGKIKLKPENILVIDDYESVFKEEVIATRDKDGCLVTSRDTVTVANKIWDGQSLIDISVMGNYSKYGMILLRNLMFKSCCFNTNIEQWFKDNNITDVTQLNGKTRAKNIRDIKLITTPSSIKYLKFGTLDMWFDNLYPSFGVVKHDKKTHFFEGQLVQTHYQLLNTLQMTKEEVKSLLKESFDFAQKLREDPAAVRYYIKYPDVENFHPLQSPIDSDNDVIYNLLGINDRFCHTKYYKNFLSDLLKAYYKTLKSGKILVNGNYSTLLGNPVEMLLQSIGIFTGESQLGIGNIHNKRFEYGKTLLGSRSPHVTVSNIWLPRNTENKEIDKYFNLTEEIVCINSIGENTLQRLSGADFDSDTCLLTDNEILVTVAKRNYKIFKVSTSLVEAKKIKRYYTSEQQAELDNKTAVNLIGEIVNLSAVLNSLMWTKLNEGYKYEDVEELYCDICQLNAMSGIEIDSAKKEFTIDNKKELEKLRAKYDKQLTGKDGKKMLPHFFAHISRQKGLYNPQKKDYVKFKTTMDYIQTFVNGYKTKEPDSIYRLAPFVSILNPKKYRRGNVNWEQINQFYIDIDRYILQVSMLYNNTSVNPTETERCYVLEMRKYYEKQLYEKFSKIRIGFSTLYSLLTELESDENKKRKKIILRLLFSCENKIFKDAIMNSTESVGNLFLDKNGDYLMFNVNFQKKYVAIQHEKGKNDTN